MEMILISDWQKNPDRTSRHKLYVIWQRWQIMKESKFTSSANNHGAVLVSSAYDVSDELRDSASHAVHFPELLAFLPRIRVRAGIAVFVILVLLGQDSAPAAPAVRLAVPVLFHPEIVSWFFRASLAQFHIL